MTLSTRRGPINRILIPTIFAALALAGCLATKPVQIEPVASNRHLVVNGESLQAIAKKYKVSVQDFAELNNLTPPYDLKAKTELVIPCSISDTADQSEELIEAPSKGLIWPVKGKIVAEFGMKNGVNYNGIGIEAPEGSVVRAAAEGRVAHVGSMPFFGKMVLLEHRDRLVTVYSHLKNIMVVKEAIVKAGQKIGTVGASGRTENPMLYFEVRAKSKPRNPLLFLAPKT